MIALPDMNYIAISSTDGEIALYDLNTPKLEKTIVVTKLPSVVTCMTYK